MELIVYENIYCVTKMNKVQYFDKYSQITTPIVFYYCTFLFIILSTKYIWRV